jgi:hypothetical protein
MKNLLLIFILFFGTSQVHSQIYELTVKSKVVGEDVLEIGSVITINEETNKIEYTTPADMWGNPGRTFTLDMKGFSNIGEELVANFNPKGNQWGTSGSLVANLSSQKLRFQSWSLDDSIFSAVYYYTLNVVTKAQIENQKKEEEKRR